MTNKIQDTEPFLEDGERMLSSVPMTERRSTWKQVMVWVGFGYVVTGLFVGGVLAGFGGQPGIPPITALWAIIIGMGSLLVLTFLLGVVAQKTGLNLALISRYSYGEIGTNLPLIIMALLTLGWFASITGMVGQIWGSFIGNPTGITVFNPAILGYENIPPITLENFLSCFVFGLIFTLTAYFGIKAIEGVATPVAPVILIIAIIVGVGMLNEGGGIAPFLAEANKLGGLGLGNAITVVTGSWIAGVVMGVDFFRFNKTVKGVFAGAVACFVLTNPLLNIVGYIGAVSVGQFNYVEWMLEKGLLLALIGVVAWTASLWTTNNAELYCNSLYAGPVLASYKKPVKRKNIVLFTGILGTILGSMAFYEMFFADFITILGAAFLPLAGPIIADYFIVKKRSYNVAEVNAQPKYRYAGLVTFTIGALLGLSFQYIIPLPFGLPSGLIALFITIVLYPIVYKLTDAKRDIEEVQEASI
ncbi:purine-cytosine permease family protein [Virgibacillus sp. W0430]|uniref:purine-cytosine permease family protein n=1 Tax=Virgibacillus sp. W0430 TaxID=3391580 RepID=UPI003F45F4EC